MRRALLLVAFTLTACNIHMDDQGDVKPVPQPKPSSIPATTVDLDVLPSLELKGTRLPPAWASASAQHSAQPQPPPP